MSDEAPQISATLQIEDYINKGTRWQGARLTVDTIEIKPETTLIIGRNPQISNLQFFGISADTSISRLHCTIHFDEQFERFMLTDEGSSNGSFINDERVMPHESTQLHDGDIIRLGTITHNGVEMKFNMQSGDQNESTRLVLKPSKIPKGTAVNVGKLLKSMVPAVDENASDTVMDDDLVNTTIIKIYDVFISYSRTDADTMHEIASYLRETGGFEVWTDEKLKPGTESWQIGVEVALEQSTTVLVLMSPDSKQSPWVRREMNYAESRGKTLLPVLLHGDPKDSIPLVLSEHQFIDMRGNVTDKLEELNAMIREKLKK